MDGTENGHPGPTPGGAEQIRLDGVSKVFADGTVGVAELDLTFAAGELSVLVGPSGCGKTTTMKMINRLIEPSTGPDSSRVRRASRASGRAITVPRTTAAAVRRTCWPR